MSKDKEDLQASSTRSPAVRLLDVRASVDQWPLRNALIRLLWRAVADGDGCVCEPGDPADICEAMSALGWGVHWNTAEFQKRAMREASKASARQRPQAVKSEQP